MALNIPDGFGIAAFHFSVVGDSEDLICTFGFFDGSLGVKPLNDIAHDVFDSFTLSNDHPWYDEGMVDQLSVTKCVINRYDDGLPSVGEWAETITGTAGTQPFPINVAILLRKGTALGGRPGRGRMFVPGPMYGAQSASANGHLIPGAIAALNPQYALALDTLETNDVPMVLLHPVLAPTMVTSLTVGPKLGTIRRRLHN